MGMSGYASRDFPPERLVVDPDVALLFAGRKRTATAVTAPLTVWNTQNPRWPSPKTAPSDRALLLLRATHIFRSSD